MADSKETAYVLPEGVASSSEAQQFPGMPGVWVAGEPVAVATLGLSDDDAADLVSSLNLPLEKVEVDREKKRDHAHTGGIVSGADLRSASTIAGGDADRSPIPGLSTAEFEARVEEETEAGVYSPVVEAAMAEEGVKPPEVKRAWPTKHDGLEAYAKEQDFTFTEETKTIEQRIAALEAAGFDPPIVGTTTVETTTPTTPPGGSA